MRTRTRTSARTAWQVTAGAAGLSLLVAACSSGGSGSSDDATSEGTDGEQITLTVATFNDFGYTDELLAEYTAENPNITVEHVKAARSEDARANLTTKLAAGGAGLADIEGVEVDWLPELMQSSNLFLDMSDPAVEGRWSDWKVKQATTPEGTLFGYATDTGPEAICYRSDLFEAAGLPTDREEVAELLGGDDATWEDYFEVGRTFTAASDSAWFDSANAIYQGLVNQMEAAYEDTDGTPKDLAENEEVKAIYEQTLAAAVDDDLSAHVNQWTPDWEAAFQADGFATMLCPAWMTGPIEERAGGVTGWDVADVFPGGGGNWGGSFLSVPASGEHTEEAKKLAEWLSRPETQIKAFTNAGTFPSQVEAYEDETLLSSTNEFFNDAPVGQIFSERALNIDVAPYKGPNYFAIHTTVNDAITKVDVEQSADADSAWDGAVQAAKDLGIY
ncbi:ABC transporter substrate-binding protein [Cellulomonas marina]|uniref:Cellobiose transport system substrate-binding protein n=1 Tax=Cellulomonas marina TaxID=988821 RepID=A0A1I0WZY5_9CELL|nr:ABC transporter substrate-binding protein [Cellulomonas marina]GIG29338.1 sugar ABC transporter substrate-binding protein [Cellulomonas marina]SFA94201.1 cellobiose transport system substrate-binding protein [Cellulomonas marina]